jgi:hypothetical protein
MKNPPKNKITALRRAANQAGNGATITNLARCLEILREIEASTIEVVWSDPASVGAALNHAAVAQAYRKA